MANDNNWANYESIMTDMVNQGNWHGILNHMKEDIYKPLISKEKDKIIANTLVLGMCAINLAIGLASGNETAIIINSITQGIIATPIAVFLAQNIMHKAELNKAVNQVDNIMSTLEFPEEMGRGRK